MNKPGGVLLFLVSVWLISSAFVPGCARRLPGVQPAMPAPGHDAWTALLKKHVRADGMVDYPGFIADSQALTQYLQHLSSSHPQPGWTREEQMAYWINAYNAFTIKLVVDHYPVASIKDIRPGIPLVNSVWDIDFIDIQGERYSLNTIEHRFLRGNFRDARIHAAINCASFSCPKLRSEAYTAAGLDAQLEEAMRDFLHDTDRNRITGDTMMLSAIFRWFGGDFRRDAGSLRAYVQRYQGRLHSAKAAIAFMPYDWKLNDLN
jgi:hypothetical protein